MGCSPHPPWPKAHAESQAFLLRFNGLLNRSAAGNEVDQNHDDGQNQQNVNESPHRVAAHHAEQPKDD